jgi:thymidylate synthase
MDHPSDDYKLIGVSNKMTDTKYNISFRYLTYRRGQKSEEYKYLDLCKHILDFGSKRNDRTGVGTISTFGQQLTFDISQSVPLLTSKRVPWKHVIEELLWFMRGDTDAKILQKASVKIWDGNTSREFLDNRGLYHYDTGVLGAGYGWQWRFFGGEYKPDYADTRNIDRSTVGGFDQLEYVMNEIKNNPYSRRILMCYWNPPDFVKTALQPCHFSVQFYVDFRKDGRYLDCHFTMRSNDVFLGQPFNLFSYAAMTYIIALKCDIKPGKLVYSGGDVHIYQNHVTQVQQQLTRQPRPLPKLFINPDVKDKKWEDITIDDFEVIGYYPYPAIKAPMAV